MRRLTLLYVLCCLTLVTVAQKYGNEWINFSQKYYKFPVKTEGIYRIDSATLSKYFDLSVTNPKNFQVFIRGKEQAILVKGDADNKVNTGDFIEFYSDGRVGMVDSLLYTNISYQPSPYLQLFNDTLFAFITTNTSTSNKRFTIEPDISFSSYPQAAYAYREKVYAFFNNYNDVSEFPDATSDPLYTQAEGKGNPTYFDLSISPSPVPMTTTFSALNPYSSATLNAYVEYSGAGYGSSGNGNDHRMQVFFKDQGGNDVLLTDTTFAGFLPIRQSYTLSSQLVGNSSNITFSAYPNAQYAASTSNMFIVFYTKLIYPQTLNLGGNSFYRLFTDDHPQAGKSTYSFTNFNVSNSTGVEYFDLTNSRYIKTVLSGSSFQVLVPNGSGRKHCVMAGDSMVINIKSLKPVGKTGYFTDYKLQAGNNTFVMVYNNTLLSSATDYKNYRQSPAGGGYNVVFGDISSLYEQFSYGVNQHPISIKNFLKYLNDNSASPVKHVLLIGHGVYPKEFSLSGYNYQWDLVPAIGVPNSDNLFTAALSGTNSYVPEIPIGRIAALSNDEVQNYLLKVKQHDATGDAEWKKNVLHFVGGDDQNLVNTLSGYMNDYKTVLSDTLFGANVTTFKKNTTAPIQTSINDSVFNIINNGCSILTFFGHGSLTGFDQAIDNPAKYNNAGKYPFLIANSCNSGDIFVPGFRSVSESFLFAPQKGSVGFIATTTFGQDYNLYKYTMELLRAISYTRYGRSLGEAVQEAVYQSSTHGQLEKFVAMDMAFHGDPSIKINVGAQPDYQLANNDISFDLKKYTDSVGILIHYKNTGTARRTELTMQVRRYFPDGDSVVIYKLIDAPYYKDTLRFYMPIDFDRGYGLNRFTVDIDHFNQVAEKLENNNSTNGTVDFFIPGGDIYPVYPYNYAIVPKTSSATLKASTSDPFAPLTSYRFQLDTCDKFTSPIQSTVITSKGGVIEWNVNLPFADSTVYYWRVSRDSTAPDKGFIWRENSFQTIGTKRGWSQAHFNQFKTDKYQFVRYRKDLRKFTFENAKNIVSCRDGIHPYLFAPNINFFLNSIRLSEWGCSANGWNVAVFDSISAEPKRVSSANPPEFGPDSNCVCVSSLAYYSFGKYPACGPGGYVNSSWQNNLEKFLNAIPANNYVLAFTMGFINDRYSRVSTYSNSLYSAFESIGAKTIRTTPDTVAYILFGRKGMTAGQGHELVGKNAQSTITLEDSIKTRWKNGFIASERIGPAARWNSLHWRVKPLESALGDTTILKVVGINLAGTADTVATFRQDLSDVYDLYNFVDAERYPYLQLVALMRDNINTTAPQLRRWQVLYDEAPECAINPLKGFASINDTLMEGDDVVFRFPIENISHRNFEDTLAISYWIEDNQRNKIMLPDKLRKGPFNAGELIIDTLKVNSYQLKGSNALWINVNPLRHKFYQNEQYFFNNVGRFPFKVNGDITNPLLDVTFDGVRILNGDIVSSKPNILISLKDENKFLALNDTGAFTVLLQTPGQPTSQRIYFAQGLVFTPASLPRNSCSIQYNPALITDGKYTLIVQAKDRSNNASARQDYRIQFEVNNQPSVTGVLNYPNPFTTSTKFVFTLTGSEIPEVFTIRIMTISGKIVREITREELGYLHIGRNITDYAWDGKDQYGDKLANGVYLYHVITRLNGAAVEKSASGADKFFVKEYGKMVIMR